MLARGQLAVAAALLAALAAGCASRHATAPPASLSEVRQAEADLGFEPTKNFHRHGRRDAYWLCYAAEKLDLPDDYSGLLRREGRGRGCPFDPRRYDVFVYPAEALAGREAPVTETLAAAEPARRDFVVAHEDFHDQPGVRELPATTKEAASMLAGLLAAAEAARAREGETAYRAALAEAEVFLAKSRLVNEARVRLRALYAQHRAGALEREAALQAKQALLDELARDCRALEPRPRAFDACPAVLNNAGVAFDATYTLDYPRMFEIYEQANRDAAAAIAALRELTGE